MAKYTFGDDVYKWLSKQIGSHFDGRRHGRGGLAASNGNLRKSLGGSVTFHVLDDRGDLKTLIVPGNAELVGFRSVDSREGIIATIFAYGPDEQFSFTPNRHLLHRTTEDLFSRGTMFDSGSGARRSSRPDSSE